MSDSKTASITGLYIMRGICLVIDLESQEPAIAISLRNGNIQFAEGYGPEGYHRNALYACNVHGFELLASEDGDGYTLSLSFGHDEVIQHNIGITKDFEKAQDWVSRANALYE